MRFMVWQYNYFQEFRNFVFFCFKMLFFFFSSEEVVGGRVVYSRLCDMGLGDQGCFKEFDCVDVLVDVLEIYVQEILL